ncbi:hypothetical protein SG34_010505 [Thalassomonas viridans]|uniref:Uncharacterized protein n=1 Tax=Thalassomonas viridans TaxID=137584 RepID=A0AAE9Z8Z5_9GAMM|nr:hypothetical protein [Thalassomonas viridans]WDE07277.1 hypothetical protein SG34_010505 [Thalassomonas viridans]
MSAILTAISIAKAVGLTNWLNGKLSGSDNDAAKIATKVIDFAVQQTGERTPNKMIKKLNADPDLTAKLRQTLQDNEHELDMAPYQDRADARAMHNQHPQQADKIADRIMTYNPIFIFLVLAAHVLAVIYLQDHSIILSTITSVLGMAIKSLFDERSCVTGFYFGSSMGSKAKDQHHQEGLSID